MNKMTWGELIALIVFQSIVYITVVFLANAKITEGTLPAWIAIIVISTWFVLCVEVDRFIWEKDIRSKK